MHITQFFTVLIARRSMIFAALIASLIGALLVVVLVPPRYKASSRVMLDIIKPDPVTGQVLANQFVRGYTKTQTELIRDFKVAGAVVDELGWTSDPAMLAQYGASQDPQAARRRMAQIIIDRTDAQLIEGSNILEITYTAWSPDAAKLVADTIRRAYVDTSLNFKRDSASQSGDWFQGQADKARRQLAIAEQRMSQFEREHGVIMQADKTDVDTARLSALSTQGEAPASAGFTPVAPVSSPSGAQLAQVDAQLAQARRSLGANHPTIRELQQRRAGLAAQAAQERAAAGSANAAARSAAGAAGAASGANRRALEAQKAKVLANRENVAQLRQLQDEVDLRRDQYQKAAARVAELRLQGDVSDSGLTLLGSAVAPERPAFPNIPLVFGGAFALGLMLGTIAALLTELLSRRVRTARDLQDVADDIPLLAVISSRPPQSPTWITRLKKTLPGGRQTEEALAA